MTTSTQGHRDHTGDAETRMDLYHKLCASVKKDREGNAAAAWEQRQQNLHPNSGSADGDHGDSTAQSKRVVIPEEYY